MRHLFAVPGLFTMLAAAATAGAQPAPPPPAPPPEEAPEPPAVPSPGAPEGDASQEGGDEGEPTPAEAPEDVPGDAPAEAPPGEPGEAPPGEAPPGQPPGEAPPGPTTAPAPGPPTQPGTAQPGYGQPQPQQPGYGPQQPGYGPQQPGYDQPGYGQPPPGYGPGYGPPEAPPQRPSEPPPEDTLLWSVRYDPFDLLFRRVTLEGEVALGSLPLSVELSPAWIFDSPSEGVDEMGFDIAARLAWYVQGTPLEGFWVKAHGELETFKATLYRGDLENEIYFGKPDPQVCDPDSETGTCKKTINSFIAGAMIGNSTVFGEDGGFTISGGIGIGVAVTPSETLRVLPCTDADRADGNPHCPAGGTDDAQGIFTTYNDDASRIRLLGSLSLGVTF